ncbi:MAG: cell division protein ZapA [Deltaproteobacteria bacterium]|jgi:cell division protein ZapA (FtsZ GTPase activity inhibitor)|nr:cell division protein ZapA [Deltaproteobacteria bacterium]
MKRTITLEIAGARYRMASDADESHLTRLSDLINDRVAALGPKVARTASPAQLLAVVALGLADELVQAEERRKHVERTAKDAVGRALERLDHAITSAQRLEAESAPRD